MNAIITTTGPYLDTEGDIKTFRTPQLAEMFMFLERIQGEIREI